MRVELQPAYLLHQRPYRDTSVILEALTPEFGRVGVLAKGVRTARSRLRGVLQSFQPLLISWQGRGELVTLTGAEANGKTAWLAGRRLVSGLYVNELVLRLVQRHDGQHTLFQIYEQAVSGLAGEASEAPVLRRFEIQLLQELGYGLVLDHAVDSGAAIQPDILYRYELERGPLTAPGPDGEGIPIHGRTLLALAQGCFEAPDTSPDILTEAKRLMRAALALYLGDRPLKSRELWHRGL